MFAATDLNGVGSQFAHDASVISAAPGLAPSARGQTTKCPGQVTQTCVPYPLCNQAEAPGPAATRVCPQATGSRGLRDIDLTNPAVQGSQPIQVPSVAPVAHSPAATHANDQAIGCQVYSNAKASGPGVHLPQQAEVPGSATCVGLQPSDHIGSHSTLQDEVPGHLALRESDHAVVSQCIAGTKQLRRCFWAETLVRKQKVVVEIDGIDVGTAQRASLCLFRVEVCSGQFRLIQEPRSVWWQHVQLRPEHFRVLAETCAGMGALAQGAAACGVETKVRNELQARTCQFLQEAGHKGVIRGNIGQDETVLAMREILGAPAMLAAGISCQPYSRLGDAKGGLDDRAKSLPYTLRAGMLLQSSAILLECVPQAQGDPWVESCLDTYCAAMGFSSEPKRSFTSRMFGVPVDRGGGA